MGIFYGYLDFVGPLRRCELYDGLYTLYENGLIISKERKVRCRNGYRTIPSQKMKHRTDSNGYKYVGLTSSEGICTNYRIHRLLMMCFKNIPNSEELVVNHLDGDKGNNRFYNLEWCTRKENAIHALSNKLINLNYNYIDFKEAVLALRDIGWSNAKIGRAFGKTSEHIGSFLKAHGYKSKKGKKGGKL